MSPIMPFPSRDGLWATTLTTGLFPLETGSPEHPKSSLDTLRREWRIPRGHVNFTAAPRLEVEEGGPAARAAGPVAVGVELTKVTVLLGDGGGTE
ncbi:hypothetical protein HaLaN_12436, partial [Haematococcus lacustris]